MSMFFNSYPGFLFASPESPHPFYASVRGSSGFQRRYVFTETKSDLFTWLDSDLYTLSKFFLFPIVFLFISLSLSFAVENSTMPHPIICSGNRYYMNNELVDSGRFFRNLNRGECMFRCSVYEYMRHCLPTRVSRCASLFGFF